MISRLDKRKLAFILIFLVGLSILLYPLISSTWNQMLANKTMHSFDETVSKIDPKEIDVMLEAANRYNDQLLPKKVPDAFSIRDQVIDLEYEALLDVTKTGMMGYIEIPAIKVKSPIYHYTTEDVLEKGVGHLFGSSLPVGGKGTHAVLTAHRGLPNNKLFTDLDKVKKGDRFFITVLDEILAYQIDQILVVEPDQTEALALEENKDYVTLVTCTPYGVNTHRILCRGHRIPYVPGAEDKDEARNWINMNILTALIGAIIGILAAFIIARKLKKRRNRQDALDLAESSSVEDPEITETTEATGAEEAVEPDE